MVSRAVAANHKYAQYSLAGLYYQGQGEEQSYEQAHNLYRCSAEQGNPYADYELAKMYRDGIGTQRDIGQAEAHFQNAFSGFFSLEADSHDDKLQYRLGQMLHTGTGTGKDDTAAAHYWECAARLGNVNAQYALGKLWLEMVPETRSRRLHGLRKLPKAAMPLPSMHWEKSIVMESMCRGIWKGGGTVYPIGRTGQ